MLMTISRVNMMSAMIVTMSKPKSALYLVDMIRILSPNSVYTVNVLIIIENKLLSKIILKNFIFVELVF